MLQNNSNNKGRFCPDCGMNITQICPLCHGLGYTQPLPLMPAFTVTICDHPNERGEYCSICGTRLKQQPLRETCTTCLGKGWVPAPSHICIKKISLPPRRF
ncbi:hypothetical protein GF312_18200 [Candidatus Poribacteria bacterium]|nr:hypothetical protein [Candidatus Poribacteria bacterium]